MNYNHSWNMIEKYTLKKPLRLFPSTSFLFVVLTFKIFIKTERENKGKNSYLSLMKAKIMEH